MTALVPCPSCRRHTRVEAPCAFCGAPLPPDLAPAPAAKGRLTRAALFALTASVTACASSEGSRADPSEAGSDAGSDAAAIADATSVEGGDPYVAIPMYGAPGCDAAAAVDASPTSAGGAALVGLAAAAVLRRRRRPG